MGDEIKLESQVKLKVTVPALGLEFCYLRMES